MAIWQGTGFVTDSGVAITESSGFFLDTNGNYYYYDQNYNGLFPVSVLGTTPTYGGNFIPATVSDNISMSVVASLAPSISTIATVILNGRLDMFTSNAKSVIATATQTLSDLVANNITAALGTTNISSALQTYAPFLVNPQLNFGLQDALNNWTDGPQLIKNLSTLLQTSQVNIQASNDATKRISDFKKKIVKQQIALADQTRQVHGQAESFLNNGTFANLTSAFPSSFGPLTSVLNNAQNILAASLASVLPTSGLDAGSSIAGIINGFIGGSSRPAIINPLDKIMNDITKLDGALGPGGSLSSFVFSGFSSFIDQQNYINQAVNLLNNIVSQIPVIPQTTAPTPLTDPNQINAALLAYKNLLIGKNTSINTLSQQALSQLMALMNITGPTLTAGTTGSTLITTGTPGALGTIESTPVVANDPFYGGTYGNLGVIQTVMSEKTGVSAATPDQSITAPNISISPDPAIAASQNAQATAQANANQPGVTGNVPRGSGINILDEVPMRPRNVPIDGSDGDYQVIHGIQL